MAHGWANGPMVRVHQRLNQRGGKIFENVHGLAAAWPWTFANVYRGCMGHVRLCDSAGAQPSHEHHVTHSSKKDLEIQREFAHKHTIEDGLGTACMSSRNE